MLKPTSSALDSISPNSIDVTALGHALSVPTTKEAPPPPAGTATPEKSLESGSFVVDNYVRIGKFDFSRLKVASLPTGFTCFDRHFVLKRGKPQLVTIAAFTSHGKTALMMQLASNISLHGPVFVHSFEMTQDDLDTRMVAAISNTPSEKIMRGEISEEKLEIASREYAKRQLYLCKSTENNVNYIQTSCYEKAKQVGKPLLIVVDYIQLMRSIVRQDQRTRDIADSMRGLKTLAEQLECPILIGSQLNRECEKRGKAIEQRKGIGEYRPIISDLAESSAIAHDSDVVLFVTRQQQYDGTRENQADILCSKNRSGQTFEEIMQWSGELCSFYENGTQNMTHGKHGL